MLRIFAALSTLHTLPCLAETHFDEDEALLLQVHHHSTLIESQASIINKVVDWPSGVIGESTLMDSQAPIINKVVDWPGGVIGVLVEEAMCSAHACGAGLVQNSIAGCSEAFCTDAQCCGPEASCADHTCGAGKVSISATGCGAITCNDGHCCATEDTCVSVNCLDGFVKIAGKTGCAKTHCQRGDCCAEEGTCNQFPCGEGYIQIVEDDHGCAKEACVRDDCCDVNAQCEHHVCSGGFVRSDVMGYCNAVTCTDAQCCQPEATCEQHVCPDGQITVSQMGCAASACSDVQCCGPAAVCADHTCSNDQVISREGHCGAAQCSDEQCCDDQGVCADFACPTGYSPTGSSIGCGKFQCAVGDCCYEEDTCSGFPCGNDFILKADAGLSCNKEFCAKDDCCDAEAVCSTHVCPPDMVMTGVGKCGAAACFDTQCCENEASCAGWDCGQEFTRLHEEGCGATSCSAALCCVETPIECVVGDCSGQKEACRVLTTLTMTDANMKVNNLNRLGSGDPEVRFSPAAEVNGVSVDVVITTYTDLCPVVQCRNGNWGPYAQLRNGFFGITMDGGTSCALRIEFQDTITGSAVQIPSVMFTWLDIDGGAPGANPYAQQVSTKDADRVVLVPDSDVAFTENDGTYRLLGIGGEHAPPTTLATLTESMRSASSVLVYQGRSSFDVVLETPLAYAYKKVGRVFNFAAEASFACS